MSSNTDSIYSGMVKQPCPPMTLRIGVAGHRRLEKATLPVLRQQLKKIYADLHRLIQRAASHEIAKNIYAPEPFVIRFISPLAEGADRLCIEPELMPFEVELAAILPFARAEYEKDFAPASSDVETGQGTVAEFRGLLKRIGFDEAGDNAWVPLIELDGSLSHSPEDYNDCAKVLVEHSDLLVAVYDGNDSENTGTAATVRAAMEQGVTVIHVSTLAPRKVVIRPSGLFEHAASELDYTLKNLEGELNRLLLFSDVIKTKEEQAQVIERFQRYRTGECLSCDTSVAADFTDDEPMRAAKASPTLGSEFFSFFKKTMTRGKRVGQKVDEMNHSAAIDTNLKKKTDIEGAISNHHLYSAFLRTDQLASHYADIHRSSFLLIYILGALALSAAASALAFGGNHNGAHHGLVFALVVVELLLLGMIYLLFRKDRRHDYHGRWLEYRCLAELFRPLIYMNFLGRSVALFTKKSTSATLNREFVGHHSSARCWIYIYLVSVLRWVGFSYCQLGGEYKKDVVAFVNEAWIRKQIDYHTKNAAQMTVMGDRLRSFSFALFFATLAAVLVKLGILVAEISLGMHFSLLLTSSIGLLTAVFPILATTAFSIRNHAEFDISAQRSLSMRAVLLAHLKTCARYAQHVKSEIIHRDLQRLAHESINETAEWLEIYEVKETEPA
ncbi:hypothetical protein [uncultured Desulfosarcina sp.]|uniref:hypothetical protein n=1 Tax=uncultured Desulfosarcina sp. TaxID=218289 RepID=UPI0029C7321D|nr:hypothetical protein [uncultured Desulfosarcina sp.]